MKFFGRESEIQTLQRELELCRKRRCARMAVVTGRRRVGKTKLIMKALSDQGVPFIYSFVPQDCSEQDLASEIVTELADELHISFPPTLTRLPEAIRWLLEVSRTHPLVLVIDECQEIDSFAPGFWSQLQKVWDLGKDGAQLLLVMSGSLQSSLERIFGSRSQPLYGRADILMTLQPFSTATMREIFACEGNGAGPSDFLMLYALTGGVARYVEYFADNLAMTREAMLHQVFSTSGSWFRAEGGLMLSNEFHITSSVYLQILRKIASGATKRSEIQDNIPQDISAYLIRLEELFGIITRISPILQENQTRLIRYRIADPYFRFWLTFISPKTLQSLAQAQRWERLIKNTEQGLPTFLGRTLEQWFIRQTIESGDWDVCGGWWDKNGENEIDLAAVNKDDKKILIAEVKTNPQKIDMTKLQLKADVFLKEQKLKNYTVELKGLSVNDMLA